MVEMEPLSGLGLGWRPPLAEFVARRRDLGFLEVVAESLPLDQSLPLDPSLPDDGPLPAGLAERAALDPWSRTASALSLGGAEELEPDTDRRCSPRAAERLDRLRW